MGGQHKSKASVAAGKKTAAAMKKKGTGIFKPVTYSAALAKLAGKAKGTRGDAVKAFFAYLKKAKLTKGRTLTADATLKTLGISSGTTFKAMGPLFKNMK